MKLCQKCIDAIVKDLETGDFEKDKIMLPTYTETMYIPRPALATLLRYLFPIAHKSECEFWSHKELNEVYAFTNEVYAFTNVFSSLLDVYIAGIKRNLGLK
jgi:hypothetical protein